MELNTEQRLELVKQVGEEIVTEEELRKLLETETNLVAYDGFEPSGQMHIAQGILRAINVNKMTKAGFTFKMLVADWFAYLNNKMGGDLQKIHKTGEYFMEIWKAAGMDLDNVEFVWTSEMISNPKYWELVLKIAKANSLKRILKTTQALGRSESDDLSAAQIIYPCMQATDIFMLGAHVAQLGMDQRKVNMLAREVAGELGFEKPISVSHHMLQGLATPKADIAQDVFDIPAVEVTEDQIQKDTIDWREPEKEIENERYIVRSPGSFQVTTKGDKLIHWLIEIEVHDKLAKTTNIISFTERDNPQIASGLKVAKVNFNSDFSSVSIEVEYDKRDPKDKAIDMKMSKSVPDTAIFMTDTREDIQRKILKAYCPEGEINENPILDYCKHIIFEAHHLRGQESLLANGFEVKRPEKFGGDVTYQTYAELEKDFVEKKLFPLDLKNAVVDYLDKLLEPVREHFQENAQAKELLAEVQNFQITR